MDQIKDEKTIQKIGNPENDRFRRCIRLLMLANRRHHAFCDKEVSEIGMHRSQHHILMSIAMQNSTPNQKAIAKELNVSPAAITVSMQKLEKNGYIERNVAKSDSRCNDIRISPRGTQIIEQTAKKFDSVDEIAFRGFTPEELETLTDFLERICHNLHLPEEEN